MKLTKLLAYHFVLISSIVNTIAAHVLDVGCHIAYSHAVALSQEARALQTVTMNQAHLSRSERLILASTTASYGLIDHLLN